MDIIILGNGHSLKKVVEFGFDEFIEKCQKKNIKVICMNKILRYFKSNNIKNIPDYYVATDSLVNMQMYDEILEYSESFKKCFVSTPFSYVVKDNKLILSKIQGFPEIEIDTDKDKNYYDNIINDITKKGNIDIKEHGSTGLISLKIAESFRPQMIFMIGMDETYDLENKSTILVSDMHNNNYFCDSYLKSGEYISPANEGRIKTLNKHIKKSTYKFYNLSDISNIDGIRLDFDNFINNHINVK
jgi:hypothetical protein